MNKYIPAPEFDKLTTTFPVLKLYQTILQEMPEQHSFSSKLKQHRLSEWSHLVVRQHQFPNETESICKKWSEVTDEIVIQVFDEYLKNENIALFALGKWGSFELNLSSDIDLILVQKSNSNIAPSKIRQFQNILSSRDSQGFLYRTDFDLRPGGNASPLVPSEDEFINYYTNFGETWEKMALTRMRPVCGDINIINSILDFRNRFCFQRHLDFNLLDDLGSLRSKIQIENWAKSNTDKINLKFIPGGIRDLELFIHALQVVHGGKTPELRTSGITRNCKLLQSLGLLKSEDADLILKNYWNLRALENYVQSINDEQTQTLDISVSHPDSITQMYQDLNIDKCNQLVSKVIGKNPDSEDIDFINKTFEILGNQGDLLKSLMTIELKSKNKERDELQKQKLLLKFLKILFNQNGNIPSALSFMQEFLNSVKTRTSFLSLLLREDLLLKKITHLFGYSPYLSNILIRRPELLDSFVYQSQDSGSDDLQEILSNSIEKKLLSELSNGTELLENLCLEKILDQLTTVADNIVTQLLRWHNQHFQTELNLICLGKWGGKEIGFNSDLDFIFITQNEVTESDLKVARRILSRLTENQKGGSLYAIDMRLKPSGKAGPLVIQFSQLRSYIKNMAEPWEVQAYTRSRFLVEAKNLEIELEEALRSRHFNSHNLELLNSVQLELIKTAKSDLDLKLTHGGMLEVELFVQTFLLQNSLVSLKNTSTKGMLSLAHQETQNSAFLELSERYALLRLVEQTQQLLVREQKSLIDYKAESYQILAGALKYDPNSLKIAINQALLNNKHDLLKLDPRRTSS